MRVSDREVVQTDSSGKVLRRWVLDAGSGFDGWREVPVEEPWSDSGDEPEEPALLEVEDDPAWVAEEPVPEDVRVTSEGDDEVPTGR